MTEVALVVCNEALFKKELFNQIMETGDHTVEEAFTLVNQRLAIEKEVGAFRRSVKVPRQVPLELVDVDHPEIDKLLFNAGFDTIGSKWIIDICCYTWQDKMKCGPVVLGAERLDKKWLMSGNRSDDAFHYMTKDIVREGMAR
tara:strand:+ start:60 stop:488 length:429 start_codon:yes stop_codon:yes gene_type:complete